jgi:hypothetical protein
MQAKKTETIMRVALAQTLVEQTLVVQTLVEQTWAGQAWSVQTFVQTQQVLTPTVAQTLDFVQLVALVPQSPVLV